MNITSKFESTLSRIVIDLDLNFQKYLNDYLIISFNNDYPTENEKLIQTISLHTMVEISGKEYKIIDIDLLDMDLKNYSRNYKILLGAITRACFNSFCLYFETLKIGQFFDSAQNKFDEFCYYWLFRCDHATRFGQIVPL